MLPTFLSAPNLVHPALTHGFFMRHGGVCEGVQDQRHDDLALGYRPGLDPALVDENRRRVMAEIGLPLRTLTQVHGTHVVVVEGEGDDEEADAMVSAAPGIALGTLTADCVPILLADPPLQVATCA